MQDKNRSHAGPGNKVSFIHLRTRSNGIPQEKGGYTVAIKLRTDGKYSVTICQCNTNQKYDAKLGEKIAEMRLSRGQFFVQDYAQLEATLTTLHDKLCTGGVRTKLAFDVPRNEESLAA